MTPAQAGPNPPLDPRYVRRALLHALVFVLLLIPPLAGAFRCPFALLFHAPCPGCGTTRALRGLYHLDFASMLRFNPVSPLVFAAGGLLAARSFVFIALDGDTRRVASGPFGRALIQSLLFAAALEIVVWITRWFGCFGGPVPI